MKEYCKKHGQKSDCPKTSYGYVWRPAKCTSGQVRDKAKRITIRKRVRGYDTRCTKKMLRSNGRVRVARDVVASQCLTMKLAQLQAKYS